MTATPPVDLSLYRNARDNLPKSATVPWPDLVGWLTQHERRAEKDGAAWSPAVVDGTRSNANVRAVTAAVFDLDHATPEQVDAMDLEGREYVLHSSHSHSETNIRLRLVMPVTRPLAPAEWPAFWSSTVATLRIPADPAAKDPARLHYLPAAPEGAEVLALHGEGAALDVDALLASAPAAPAPAPAAPTAEGDVPEGGRHDALLRHCGALFARGNATDEVRTLLHAWNEAHCKPPQERADVDRIVTDIAAARERDRAADRARGLPLQKALGLERPVLHLPAAGTQLDAAAHSTFGRPALIGDTATDALGAYPLTDAGNAERFAHQHRRDVRFVPEWNCWIEFHATHWRPTPLPVARAVETCRRMYREAGDAINGDDRGRLGKHALASESASRIDGMLRIARALPTMTVPAVELDQGEFVLNVLNGTLELQTGQLRAPTREDLITRVAPVLFDAEATAPTWERVLEQWLPDPEVRRFVQLAAGYALTGSVREQVLIFLHGGGQNGKSTFLNGLKHVLGPYAKAADPGLLLSTQNERHTTGIADLKGARLVICQETEEGRSLNEPLVKQLTGGDIVKARLMHKDFIEFQPTWKIFLASNPKPRIRGGDHAIWRRIRLVPFEVRIEESQKDPLLDAKLRAEAPGILNWLVRGCLDWQRDGLDQPKRIADAGESYRAEQDHLGHFIDDTCTRAPDAFEATATLHRAYTSWCLAAGTQTLNLQAFAEGLSARGFVSARPRVAGGDKVRGFNGLRLNGGGR